MTTAKQNMIAALESDFTTTTIEMYIRAVAHDIDQRDGVLEDVIWSAKQSARHYFGRKFETKEFVLKTLKAAVEYYAECGKYPRVNYGFASTGSKSNSCKREIELINSKAF